YTCARPSTRPYASATDSSFDCRSSSLTKSACIPPRSPVIPLQPLRRRARSNLDLDALDVLDQLIVLLGRHTPTLSILQRVQLANERTHLQRLTARYIGLIRISSPVFRIEGCELGPRPLSGFRQRVQEPGRADIAGARSHGRVELLQHRRLDPLQRHLLDRPLQPGRMPDQRSQELDLVDVGLDPNGPVPVLDRP